MNTFLIVLSILAYYLASRVLISFFSIYQGLKWDDGDEIFFVLLWTPILGEVMFILIPIFIAFVFSMNIIDKLAKNTRKHVDSRLRR